ncbi:Crp/Fnr family transcriptional regulator [Erythrobacter longus]|uniref:Crp/Fnr family transcriptional regulator n=1 Tax=Erythrobacter longus TaxID=1044 RepID=A0A074MBT4_ERYLO|nr:Crp/Fnr family transcriptional regulator [Erythrobacter longus]KEO90200.1 Crp/Fnr family transcriptional regulator [Erythrobacter longus]
MDTAKTIIDTLAPDSLLRALSPEQLERLLAKSTRRSLKKGDVLINQGDEDGDFAVYLLSGALKISFVSAGGREIILNYSAPNELVGEIALLDSGPRTASVTAVVPSEALLLPTSTFLETVSTSPASVVGVMRELARRVRQLNLVVESDRTFSMGPRLARALVRLVDQNRDDGQLIYNPSQNDLGAFAGLARENVSRLLSEWESQGIIAREGRALLVRDAEYLELLAEFGDDI